MSLEAKEDFKGLFPRRETRAVVIRHLMKLMLWESGTDCAFDLAVVSAVIESDIWELCIDDRFGFSCGIRFAFFEEWRNFIVRPIWIIGSRRDNQPLTDHAAEILMIRKQIIESLET
ncbi:MAG: hypothetical protein WD065_16705 [Planctomycetaceae bacterium]